MSSLSVAVRSCLSMNAIKIPFLLAEQSARRKSLSVLLIASSSSDSSTPFLHPSPYSNSASKRRRNMSAVARRIGKLVPSNTVFLLCDIQERFRDVIHHFPQVVRTAKLLTNVGKELEIPTIATEQYPKAFGVTVAELETDSSTYPIPRYEKKLFSMCTDEVKAKLTELSRSTVVVFGIEAHVCVQQTALDLLEQGYDVHVLVDGVSSQRAFDRAVAIKRMEQAGAYLTTSESLIFMLLGGAAHPNFKTISGLIKEHGKHENPFPAHL